MSHASSLPSVAPPELLRGAAAHDALAALLSASTAIPAVVVDPQAHAGGEIQILAVANRERAVLLDPNTVPALSDLLLQPRALGAYDAKAVHGALMRTVGLRPNRWACIRNSELLIASGRECSLALPDVAQRYGLSPPPRVKDGLAAMAAHAIALAHIVAAQVPVLQAAQLIRVSRLEAAAVAPIAEMQYHGMPLDVHAWRQLDREAQRERHTLYLHVTQHLANLGERGLFGSAPLNLDSDDALKTVLGAVGHPVPDARRRTLAALPQPLGPWLSRYRELGKLVSTYGEQFLEHVRADGRVHATFEQIGAATGRMACHAPNLQAVVKDAPHRACFHVASHRRLVMGDYATCELRILAEMSGDPVFIDAFERGEDVHATVASRIFRTPVSKDHNARLRERAKAVSFGLVYGMGAGGLARSLGIDTQEAHALLDNYFNTFPKIRGFLDSSARAALRRGEARTLSGRRLAIAVGETRATRAQAERVAKNMPIQGTSADITKLALAAVRQALQTLPSAWIVHCVHDEIVVECDVADSQAVAKIVSEQMRAAGAELLSRVPLEVDVRVAQVWGK